MINVITIALKRKPYWPLHVLYLAQWDNLGLIPCCPLQVFRSMAQFRTHNLIGLEPTENDAKSLPAGFYKWNLLHFQG